MMHFPLVRPLKLRGKHYTCDLALCRLAIVKTLRFDLPPSHTNEIHNNRHAHVSINYAILIKPSTLELDFLHYKDLCCFLHAL